MLGCLLPWLAALGWRVDWLQHDRHGRRAGDAAEDPAAAAGIRCHGNPRRGDIVAVEALPGLLRAVRPDAVLWCHDPWLPNLHRRALDAEAPAAARVLYCPVEFDWLEVGAESLEALDRVVPMTRYGARVLAGLLGPAGAARLAPPVPHPVDGRVAPPPLDPAAARAALVRRGRLPAEAAAVPLLVLNGNRHRARKRLDLTVRGFARSLRGRGQGDGPPPLLVVHAAPSGPCGDLAAIAAAEGETDRIVFTGAGETHPDWPDADLALLYAAAEVGINTADGEGWGLVAMEHAAAGAAQVVPGRGATMEIWQGAALLLPPDPTPADVAIALAALNDPARRGALAVAARRRAADPALAPEAVAAALDRTLREAVADRAVGVLANSA